MSRSERALRETLVLTRADLEGLLTMDLALEAVEGAFAAHGRGETRMPAKVYLDLPEFEGDFRAMPAYMPAQQAAGLKWVSSHSANPARGRPAVIAVFVLSDPETAEPLAVMDGTHLTLMRTGAAGGVAARHLARPGASAAALVGCGAQSPAQLEALLAVRELRTVRLYDPVVPSMQALAERFSDRGLEIVLCDGVEECVWGADLVVTTTPSHGPIVQREWIAPGTHLSALGADAPGKQELDPRILLDGEVFIDDPAQALHSGEVNVPLAAGTFAADHVRGTLGQVVAGLVPGRSGDDAITVFDSTGLAVQDVATARAVYDRALAEGVGTSLPLVVAPG